MAILISIPVVMFIFVFVNIAYFAVIPVDEIMESATIAITFADYVLGPLSKVMPFFVAISCIGGLNGSIFTSSRIFFVGAR